MAGNQTKGRGRQTTQLRDTKATHASMLEGAKGRRGFKKGGEKFENWRRGGRGGVKKGEVER